MNRAEQKLAVLEAIRDDPCIAYPDGIVERLDIDFRLACELVGELILERKIEHIPSALAREGLDWQP